MSEKVEQANKLQEELVPKITANLYPKSEPPLPSQGFFDRLFVEDNH